MEKIFRCPWQVPFGGFSLKLDPLSAVFLLAISVLVLCAAVYGIGYMRQYKGQRPLAGHVIFFALLAVSLVTVVTANNAVLFLCAWEAVSISTYFLIIFNEENPAARKAGFLYLIVTHCGTFCLFLMFFLMAGASGSTDLSVIARTEFSPGLAGCVFLLAIAGFGVKAGFLPVHIWLPHAHPAAPSHVSALLSGVSIKAGIYGICRVLWILGVIPAWCGYVLLSIGIVSGIMGVLYALGQHELKKLLAYHSVENIGIISIGLGVGMIGRSYNQPYLAVLGFGGGLLHVINHAFFKGLLFLGAGAVIQRTGTGKIDQLGGLARAMPLVSILFLVGALSICGLPVFNGFVSEFFIYSGLFQGLLGLPLVGIIFCAFGILSLALMGALALACFAKVYGTVFLGEPRAVLTQGSGKTSGLMTVPMLVLAALCVWIGLAPGVMAGFTFSAGQYLTHVEPSPAYLDRIMPSLCMIIGSVFVLISLVLIMALIRRVLLGIVPQASQCTWKCAFSGGSSRAQYTSASFARPIVEYFKSVLLFRRHGEHVQGEFPSRAHASSHVNDFFEEKIFEPFLAWMVDISRKIDKKSIRYTQMYLMYIFLFLIFLLVWKMR